MLSRDPGGFSIHRLIPLAVLIVGLVAFVALGGRRYLSFAALADHRERLVALVAQSEATAALTFIGIYAALVAVSFPAAELLTIAGGFLFGRWLGTAYTVLGATIGATVVFLAARAGLAGLAARAGPWLQRFEAGFRRNALSYLLVLRLVPLFPFSLVNLVAGAAGLPLRTYMLGTLIGIVPGTFVYTSLGTGLGTLLAGGRRPDASIILRPSLLLPILALAALALLPVLYRWRRGRRTS